MAVVRTLGKNTLGDNDKMKVAMRDYDMSTHDISTIYRSSIGVGMLVPFCKILCQKGDIIDLNLINKTLSQPTLGPLFGSFKLDISCSLEVSDYITAGYTITEQASE